MSTKTTELSISCEAFDEYRADYDQTLQNLMKTMIEKGLTVGVINTKTTITLMQDVITTSDKEQQSRLILKPKFEHKITSVYQSKSEVSSEFYGNKEVVQDETSGEMVLRTIEDPQLSFFTEEDDVMAEEDNKIIALPNRAELPSAAEKSEETVDYIEADYRDIETGEFTIQKISLEKAAEIIETREPWGLFYTREDERYVAIDNSTGEAWTEDFALLSECKEWLTGMN